MIARHSPTPFALAFLIFVALGLVTASADGDIDWRQLQPHPRLLARAADFASLKDRLRSDPELARRYELLKARAVQLLDEPPAKYQIPDGKRLLSVSREVLQRVYTLALVYRIEQDERFLDRCWRELDNAASYKDWNPSHFLDTAEMTHAFAIGYDWLFHVWTNSRRQAIAAAIIDLGLTPGLRSYRGEARYGWWTGAVHNWNQVCNGGMVLGALALADENRELADEIVTQVLRRLPKAMEEYVPNGGYKEGASYWEYGTSYNVLAIAALESALGSDFGLSKASGFSATGHFPVYMTSPTGQPFNFADCKGNRAGHSAALYWLGRRFEQPLWLWHAERYSANQSGALELLWRNVPPKDFGLKNQPRAMAWPVVEAVTMRGSWTDEGAAFVGFKGGHPADNHAQADLGSFVYDASGVRWAIDLGPDNYNLPGYFDSRVGRWNFYRNRAEGHNTLVINPGKGPDQVITARSKLVATRTEGDQPFAVADLTPAYASHAKRVRRGVMLSENRDLLVQDEIEGQSMNLYWFMHTRAVIALSEQDRVATLTAENKKLIVRLVEPKDGRFTASPALPLPGSPNVDGQVDNEGVRKLTMNLTDSGTCRIVVWLSPTDAPPPRVVNMDQWK